MKPRQGELSRLVALWGVAVLLALTGCDGFFVPPNGGGGNTTTNNYVYVANGTLNSIAAFSIGTAKLTAVSGSPFSVGYSPSDLVMTPDKKFMYVAAPGAIYVYTVGSDGTLTAPSGGAAVAAISAASLDVSPDGQWLVVLELTRTVVDVLKIDDTTGSVGVVSSTPYSVQDGSTILPKMLRVAKTANYVFTALGTGGDIVYSFDTTTGALVLQQTLSLGSSQTSDNALMPDSTTSYLYIARSGTNGGLAVYTIGANGLLTSVSGSPYAVSQQPVAVLLDNTGKYVYVANRDNATISGYLIGTAGALTQLNGSPYGAGSGVTALAADNTGKYIFAAALNGTPDLSMYSFDTVSPGKLVLATSTATGTDPAGAIAVAATR